MLAHKGCTVDLFAANHRLEHGGLDLVNTNFDSDRAYGVISDSKGSRGISDSKGSRGHIGGLDGVRSDSHSKSTETSAISCHLHI